MMIRRNPLRLPAIAALVSGVLSSLAGGATAEWSALGPVIRIGEGITPGIATDHEGTVHVIIMHAGAILHRQKNLGRDFGPPEPLPRPEGDAQYNSPHVVCDASGVPHVVFARDATRASRRVWYASRQGGTWQQPLLAIERTEPDRRANYPRLTLAGGVAYVSAFTGGSSTVVKITDLDSRPRAGGRIDTNLWVAHAFPRGDELLMVGRAGASGHKLERYDAALARLGEPLLLSRGTPTKTFEPTAAVMDDAGVIHVAGATATPEQVLWYTTDRRAAAGQDVILGPTLGHEISEFTYPVLHFDRGGRLYVSYRDHTTGEARLTVFDAKANTFAVPVTVGPATTRRLRWNPHLAALPGGGVGVVWDDKGQVFFRTVGAAPRPPGGD
jgi:hypothetical protein